MRERSMLEELRRRLPDILPEGKIHWIFGEEKGADGMADLAIAGNRIHLVFEIVARPTLALVRDKAERLCEHTGKRSRAYYPMVAAPHLNDEMRELCRKVGVGYVDLSGNVWIEQGPVVIKKAVAKNLYPHQARERSPFADRASRVLRLLLERKDPMGVRAIAAEAGLDPGYVSRLLHAASEQGYVALDGQGKARARNQEEMLADWSSFYAWRRNPAKGYFYLGAPGSELMDHLAPLLKKSDSERYALTLHSGNNQVEPFVNYSVVHLYTGEGSQLEEKLTTALKLREVPVEGANLVVAKPYYRDSVFYGARQVEGIWVVSDLQLYLDLRRFAVRGIEAAERILDLRLRPLWSDR